MVEVDGLLRNVVTYREVWDSILWLFKILMVHILTFFFLFQWLHEYIISKYLEEN